MKDLAGHHTARLTESVKTQTSSYSAKAQEYMGSARDRSAAALGSAKEQTSAAVGSAKEQTSAAVGSVQQKTDSATNSTSNNPFKSEPGVAPSYSSSDFPHAPKQEPTPGVTSHNEQYERSQFGGQAGMTSY